MATLKYTPTSVSIQLGLLMRRNAYEIQHTLNSFRTYIVYVIRDKHTVLYVGRSNTSARDRIRNHLYDKHSQIGMSIKSNKPLSVNWFVEIYKYSSHEETMKGEEMLIKQLKPIFNKVYNQ